MVLAGGRAVEQGDEADEARSGTRNPNARCRCVAPPAGNRGHRLAAYRQCSTDTRSAAMEPRQMANVMRNRGTEQETPGVGGWIALVSTGILCPATLVTTVWLLWKYVPAQAA